MKIQVTQTLPNGQVTQQVLTKEGSTSLKIQAQPGAKISFNVEGGKTAEAGANQAKTGTVKKVGNNLVLELEGVELVEVTEFYANAGASVGTVEWNYLATNAGTLAATPEAVAAAGAAESAALLPAVVPAWAMFAGTAAVAVAVNNDDSKPAVVVPANTAPVLKEPVAIALKQTPAADTFANTVGKLAATDAESNALTYGITGGAAGAVVDGVTYDFSKVGTYGTLYVKASGEYVYVANATAINAVSANQTETFTLTASDGSLVGSSTLTVNIAGNNATPVMSAATATDALVDTAAVDAFASPITGTLTAIDADGTTLSFGVTGGAAGTTINGVAYDVSKVGAYGTLYVKATGEYVYVANAAAINAASANQTDVFAVTANDGELTGTSTLTINITGANDAPVMIAPTAIALTDTAAVDTFANQTGTLSATDVDTAALTYGITGSIAGGTVGGVAYEVSKVGTYGTLYVKATGEYVYVANANAINALSANQTDTFAVTVTDGGTPVTQTLTVNVAAANDTPVLAIPAAIALADTSAADTFTNKTGTLSGTDAEGTELTYGITDSGAGGTVDGVTYNASKVGTYGTLYVKGTGEYVYVANASAINALSANQTDTFAVTATDGVTPVTQTLTVNVTGANDKPLWVGTASDYTIIIGQPVVAAANLGNDFTDTDTGHAAITYSILSVDGTPGASIPGVTLNAAGAITGTPTDAVGVIYPKDYAVVVRAQDGNDPTLFTDHTYTIHALKTPAVLSISVVDGTSTNTTALGKAGETLDVSLLFSEAVVVAGSPTITLSINGQATTATYNGTGSGSTTLHFSVAIPAGAAYNGSNISLTGVTASVPGTSVLGATSNQPWDATPMPAAFTGYTVDSTAPTMTSTYSVNENTLADTATKSITLAATGETGAVTWSGLGGTDAASFTLGTGANLGKLLFNGVSDFETKTSYSVTLTATDAAGNATTGQVVTVNVTNINEAPIASATPIADVVVIGSTTNQLTSPLIDMSAYFTDPEAQAMTYSLAAGAPSWLAIDATSGKVFNTTAAPSVAVADLAVTVDAFDGTNHSTKSFKVDVVGAPVVRTTLAGVSNLDVTSKLVLEVSETVTAVAGKKITVTDLGTHTNFHDEAINNTFVLTFKSDGSVDIAHGVDPIINSTTAVRINGTGANTRILIDLPHDLDFSSNYSLAVETGAFLGSSTALGNIAFSTVNFATVAPDASRTLVPTSSTSGSSQIMSDTGALQSSYTWLDMENWGSKTGTTTSINLSSVPNNKYAFIAPDYLTEEAAPDLSIAGVGVGNFNLTMTGFGANNLIYIDDLGRSEPDAAAAFDGIYISPQEYGININLDPSDFGDGGNLEFLYSGTLLTAIQQANAGEMIGIWQAALSATHAPVIYG